MRRRRSTDRFGVEVLEQDFLGASAEDLYKRVFEIDDVDRAFLEYSTKAASGAVGKVAQEISRMEGKQGLTRDEEARLDALWREKRLLQKATEVREKRLQDISSRALVESLEGEIAMLKGELRKIRGTVD